MREFFSSVKFKILLAVLALLFGMMLYAASSDGLQRIPENLLSMVTTPFQRVSTWLVDGTAGLIERFVSFQDTAEENERLHRENAELRQQLIDYEKLKKENEELKQVTGIKELYPDFEITIASVVSRDPADQFSSFMIDKGSLHGIAAGDAVITENGLVGLVTRVGSINARVETILSPKLNVGAQELKSSELGVLSGDITHATRGLAQFSILSDRTVIREGDLLITSGSSGIYPKGLPIGTVTQVGTAAHGITKYAIVEPFEEIDRITTVQVITFFEGQGSALIDYLQ